MTQAVAEFVKRVEDYYGKYRPSVKATILQQLGNHGNPWPDQDWLDRLFNALTDSYSNRWRTPPGKLEIRQAIQEIPPEAPRTQIASNVPQIPDDAGAIPEKLAREYVSDLCAAFSNGMIRRGEEWDGRPTAYEFEQQWRKDKGIA